MKKSLVLFLVATLLLAGCTELLDSEDGETKKIEINEDIAFEKINDFMTVDEGESFGITMMQEMDSIALAEMGLIDSDEDSVEDSDVRGTVEMTQAWSPDGYHTSSIMGIGNGSSSIKKVSSMTQIGTTIYMEVGYEKLGDLCADEEEEEDIEDCKDEMAGLTDVKAYSMTTTTTHTEVIAAMAEDTQNDADGMDMMEMLEVFTFTECMGVFTPSTETVDGLQIFDVTMEDMEDSMTPDMALCLFDTDNSDSISFEEFTASDDTEEDDVDEMRTVFDNADANANGELNSAELVTFIEAVDSHDDEEDHMHGDEDEHMHDEDESGEMPDMSVAFNNAGEIEYFGMSMDGNEVKMFVLTDSGVSSIFANVDAGELVALPFLIGNEYDMANGDTFYCDNGNDIPMDYVNDGDNDCGDNSDENVDMGDGGDDSGTDERFICDNGNDIPMDFVNDGDNDCGDNSDENVDMGDGGDDSGTDDGPPSPQSVLDMTDTDQNGLMDFDEFITFLSEDDGEESAEYMTQSVIDEFNEIFNSSDLDESDDLDLDELEQFLLDLEEYMSTSDDGHDEMWTFNREMSECDSDADGMVDFDELDACVTMDIANDGYGDEGVAEQSLRWMFDLVDADEDGMLDSDEFEDFAEMTSEEPMMLCYDRYADEIDSSVTSYEDCEAGDNNWIQALQPVNDGDDGMDNDLDDDLPSESEMFSGMDGNQDGYVNASEALIYFEQMMNDAPTPEDTMEEADYDDSGNISWNEFVINWNEDEDENDLDDYHLNNSLDLDSQLYQAFNSSDYDGSGGLNLSEVQDFIDQVVVIIETLEDDEDNDEFMSIVNSAFACTDYNADDMLDSNEFSAYYSGIFGEMNLEMMLCYMDLDQSGEVSASEFAQWANQSEDSEPMSDEDWNDFLFGFEMMDTDGSGGLNADELNAVMMGDGNDDHSDDGHDDNGNHGSMFDWMISNSQDMPMEGTFDDYTIVLAMCTMDESSDDGMDMGMGTTPAMNCGDDVLSVTIADAMAQDAVVMFHDADMSGTITGGDMVHISPDIDVDGDWNMVRLYSTSADSYSDENPMLTPGFTGALGMLALLGAALLTRRD